MFPATCLSRLVAMLANSFEDARVQLLCMRWLDHERRWISCREDPTEIPAAPCAIGSLPSSQFSLHEVRRLPDRPPVAGEISDVHRFVLQKETAAALNAQLQREAVHHHRWPMAWLTGESKSNSGGYHSREEALRRSSHGEALWYDALLAQVVLPAIRSIAIDARSGKPIAHEAPVLAATLARVLAEPIRLDDTTALAAAAAAARAGLGLDVDGVPTGGRITGWLNVNGPQDLNHLHDHGADCAWSLVYYVASGEESETPSPFDFVSRLFSDRPRPAMIVEPSSHTCAAADSTASDPPPAAAAQPASVSSLGGALLLKTHEDPCTGAHSFLSVAPAAGELWCFPGHLLHAVMPRELLDGAGGSSGAATHRRGLRISVAFNVYCKSSPFRDASIGYRGEDASAAKMQSGNLRSCSLSCLEPRKSRTQNDLKHE